MRVQKNIITFLGKMMNLILEKGSDNKLCELPMSCLFFKKSGKSTGVYPGLTRDLQNQLSDSSNFSSIENKWPGEIQAVICKLYAVVDFFSWTLASFFFLMHQGYTAIDSSETASLAAGMQTCFGALSCIHGFHSDTFSRGRDHSYQTSPLLHVD